MKQSGELLLSCIKKQFGRVPKGLRYHKCTIRRSFYTGKICFHIMKKHRTQQGKSTKINLSHDQIEQLVTLVLKR